MCNNVGRRDNPANYLGGMKTMRKILAMLLAVVMVLGLCACGGETPAAETTAATASAADAVPDEMTSSDGK